MSLLRCEASGYTMKDMKGLRSHAVIRYAVFERLVSDFAPELRFFTICCDGYEPRGWRSEYPDGRMILP